MQQISDSMMKPVYVLFIDLSAAFDHIERDWLFKSIYHRFAKNDNATLIQLIEAVYKHTTTALAETPDDIFTLLTGVRQGGPDSPPLYNLFMDFVMRVFTKSCETKNIRFLNLKYRIRSTATSRESRKSSYQGNHEVNWVGYADDL